jgi:hypothetical protein
VATNSFDGSPFGGTKPPDGGPSTDIEKLEVILANLLIMQKMAVAKLDSLVDILLAKEVISVSDMEAINSDIKDVLTDIPSVAPGNRKAPG